MIVVTMTSWPKRIGNVCQVVRSVMNNTVKPDRLYLNLSTEEFEGVDELPKDLVELFGSDDRLIINWVPGENTKTFKKMFPILPYLEDDDVVLEMDDDFTLPSDFIQCRLKDFESNGRKHPVSGNPGLSSLGETCVVSPTTMFSKRMVANWERFVNDTVLHTYNDDRTLLYMFWLNGYTVKHCTKYTSRYVKQHFPVNPTHPLKGCYPIGPAYDEAVDPVVRELTGKPIRESFGYFRRADIISVPSDNGKHDVVMPWCYDGVASKVMECGDRLEIEYVIGSLKRYCSSWLGRIFIVGSEPPASIKDDVIHIPCDDPYTHAKDANLIHKFLHVCENVKDLSDDFVKVSDDQIVTCETRFEDLTPRIVRMYSDWTEQQWQRNRLVDRWHQGLWQTLHLFDLKKACFWEPHIWAPFNKWKFIEMCDKYNWRKSIACIDNTLYYNFIEQPPVRPFDHIHLWRGKAKEMVAELDQENLPRFLTWTDPAFCEKRFRDILEKTVFGC